MKKAAAILILALLAAAAQAIPPMAMGNLLWASAAAQGYSASALVMRYSMGAGETLTLPLCSGFDYNFVVDYGDGGPTRIVTTHDDPDATNTYAESGVYDVAMEGTVGAWHIKNSGNKTNLLHVVQWGDPKFQPKGLEYAFWSASALTSAPTLDCAGSPSLLTGGGIRGGGGYKE